MKSSRAVFWLTAVALVVALVAVLSIKINSPWRYMHDDNGMIYSMLGYSHVVKGPVATRFHNAYLDAGTGQILDYYLNHPPLLGLSLAAAFQLTGRTDYWVARAVAIAYHLVTVLLTAWMAWRLFNRRAAALAVLGVFLVAPMSIYFGKLVDFAPITMAFVMVALAAHLMALQAREAGRSPWLWLGAATPAWFLAMQANWDAHLFLGALFLVNGVECFHSRPPRRAFHIQMMAYATVLSIAGIGFALAHTYWIGGEAAMLRMAKSASMWTAARGVQQEGWTYLITGPLALVDLLRRYYAFGPFLLAVLWLIRKWKTWPSSRLTFSDRWLLMLFVSGATMPVIALRGVKIHAYMAYYLLPFIALATADMTLWWLDWWLERRQDARQWSTNAGMAGMALLVLITLAHSVWILRHRYSRDWGFAVRVVAQLRQRYQAPPGQREADLAVPP